MKYFRTLLAILFLSLEFFSCKKGNESNHAGKWTQVANFPGLPRESAIGFAIGNKAYVGSGLGDNYYDFYEYNPSVNTWTARTQFPVTVFERNDAVGFSIGDKGYILTGFYSDNLKDVWEFDPVADTWTQKNDFPGVGRLSAAAFSIGNKGYFGTGVTYNSSGQQCLQDWWEYDPSTDTWKQKADFPNGGRYLATALAANGKGYFGLGANNLALKDDWWEYDPATDVWTQKANFPAGGRNAAAGFVIGTSCYVGNGGLGKPDSVAKDWWEFDVLANKWTQKTSQPQERFAPVAFAINGKGYVGTGYSSVNFALNDMWEFEPN